MTSIHAFFEAEASSFPSRNAPRKRDSNKIRLLSLFTRIYILLYLARTRFYFRNKENI